MSFQRNGNLCLCEILFFLHLHCIVSDAQCLRWFRNWLGWSTWSDCDCWEWTSERCQLHWSCCKETSTASATPAATGTRFLLPSHYVVTLPVTSAGIANSMKEFSVASVCVSVGVARSPAFDQTDLFLVQGPVDNIPQKRTGEYPVFYSVFILMSLK